MEENISNINSTDLEFCVCVCVCVYVTVLRGLWNLNSRTRG